MSSNQSYIVFFKEEKDQVPKWNIIVNDIELVAGMLAAGLGIMEELNYNTKKNYYIDSDADVSTFRLVNTISDEDLENNSNGKLSEGQYGIWMHSDKRFHYSLYGFRKASFFQGIISICSNFGVDFRNYIYGVPFDKYGNQYALSKYVMSEYQIGQDAPDLDDIEEEEAGDENIINPWADEDENNYEPPDI